MGSNRRDFLQGANVLDIVKHGIGGRMWSEKLNGIRCYWDGGVSRKILKSEVPWANCRKDSRYKIPPTATGLWTKYGNVIHAPGWFLDLLPAIALDGELWNPNLTLQQIMSIVKKLVPDTHMWKKIGFHVFDMPAPELVYGTGVISSPNFKKVMSWSECQAFIGDFKFEIRPKPEFPFWKTYNFLERLCDDHTIAQLVRQEVLPMVQKDAWEYVQQELDSITDEGGEGLVIRHTDFPYRCKKSDYVIKMKKYDDAEGIVIGYTAANEGKIQGLMGNVILRLDDGRQMELSGFTNKERLMEQEEGHQKAGSYLADHPGEVVPNWIHSGLFPRGTKITYRHRGFTGDGIPNEAHYHRVREDE